jgi:hypothetical protein
MDPDGGTGWAGVDPDQVAELVDQQQSRAAACLGGYRDAPGERIP